VIKNVFDGALKEVRKRLEEPRAQIALFTWAYRLGLAMLLVGYLIIGYYLWRGGFLS